MARVSEGEVRRFKKLERRMFFIFLFFKFISHDHFV